MRNAIVGKRSGFNKPRRECPPLPAISSLLRFRNLARTRKQSCIRSPLCTPKNLQDCLSIYECGALDEMDLRLGDSGPLNLWQKIWLAANRAPKRSPKARTPDKLFQSSKSFIRSATVPRLTSPFLNASLASLTSPTSSARRFSMIRLLISSTSMD
jgi:hypothetical protein